MKSSSNPVIDHITETLRSRILKGEYQQGIKLSENGLSGEFGTSRTPIREALKRLEQDNLVTVLPHSGTYVKSLTKSENIEITEIRCYLESLAFRLACLRCADTTILSSLCDQMENILSAENVDFIAYGKTHYLFHRHLIELSGNKTLLDLYSRLNLNSASQLFYREMDKEQIHLTETEHRQIVEALSAHDMEKGEDFMFQHLWKKRERILESN